MFPIHDEIRASVVIGMYASLNENVQVNGFVFIADMTGYTMKHMTRIKTEDMKKMSSMWQASHLTLHLAYTVTNNPYVACNSQWCDVYVVYVQSDFR